MSPPTAAAPLPSAPLPSSPDSAVHVGTYLARCRDRVLPALRPDPDADRENARTPAQAVALLQILIERANAWRVLADCERGRPLELAGSQLERVTGGLLSARVAVTCLDLLQRHGYVTHWVESAGRGAIRMVRLELAAVAHAQRVAGWAPTVDDDTRRESVPPRRETLPPRRHKDYRPLGTVGTDRSSRGRARELPAANERTKGAHMDGQTDANERTKGAHRDGQTDGHTGLDGYGYVKPSSAEFTAAAPAVAAFQAHRSVILKLQASRTDSPVRNPGGFAAVKLAAAAAGAGATPDELGRCVSRALDGHSPAGDARESRRVHSFGYPPIRDALADLLAAKTAVAPVPAEPPPEPAAEPAAEQAADVDGVDPVILDVMAMGVPALRAELDRCGAEYPPDAGKYALRVLVFAALEAALRAEMLRRVAEEASA